ncbi:hypothetical protein C8J56DRAFT_953904 [Mycena floridula]|nr:hypothetical protein C8J56DRAFT_953904 [Mycena floridula]
MAPKYIPPLKHNPTLTELANRQTISNECLLTRDGPGPLADDPSLLKRYLLNWQGLHWHQCDILDRELEKILPSSHEPVLIDAPFSRKADSVVGQSNGALYDITRHRDMSVVRIWSLRSYRAGRDHGYHWLFKFNDIRIVAVTVCLVQNLAVFMEFGPVSDSRLTAITLHFRKLGPGDDLEEYAWTCRMPFEFVQVTQFDILGCNIGMAFKDVTCRIDTRDALQFYNMKTRKSFQAGFTGYITQEGPLARLTSMLQAPRFDPSFQFINGDEVLVLEAEEDPPFPGKPNTTFAIKFRRQYLSGKHLSKEIGYNNPGINAFYSRARTRIPDFYRVSFVPNVPVTWNDEPDRPDDSMLDMVEGERVQGKPGFYTDVAAYLVGIRFETLPGPSATDSVFLLTMSHFTRNIQPCLELFNVRDMFLNGRKAFWFNPSLKQMFIRDFTFNLDRPSPLPGDQLHHENQYWQGLHPENTPWVTRGTTRHDNLDPIAFGRRSIETTTMPLSNPNRRFLLTEDNLIIFDPGNLSKIAVLTF